MLRGFEIELKELKDELLKMGGYVELAISKATEGLNLRDARCLKEVRVFEDKINEAHILIDNMCLEILARLSPVAADLRLILSVVKINTDLERMGDQAMNISYNTEHYLDDKSVELSLELPKMSELVKAMVRDALDAFMRGDIELAREVLTRDDAVDKIKNNSFKLMVPYMQNNPNKIEAALDLILIARNLERMGDHATNIAEDVIFTYTGVDVRHGQGKISDKSTGKI